VADADAIALHAEASGRDPQAAQAVALAVDRLAQLGRMTLDSAAPAEGGHGRAIQLARGLLDRLDVARDGRTVALSAEGFGTFADLAAILAAEIAEARGGDRAAAAGPKAERR
jgi:hypothetical protein